MQSNHILKHEIAVVWEEGEGERERANGGGKKERERERGRERCGQPVGCGLRVCDRVGVPWWVGRQKRKKECSEDL